MLRAHYHQLTIAEVIEETADTKSFILDVPPELASTFAYSAGQFCTFRCYIDDEPVVRCYSMSSSPDVGEPLMTTVKRVPGGRMSNWMADNLKLGSAVEVMGPAGLFVLRESVDPILAFAGGSGITPVFSLIKTALATTRRSIKLMYANRTEDSIIFRDQLRRLAELGDGRLEVHHHVDSRAGFLDQTACAEFVGDLVDSDFYVCGPGPFMDIVEEGLVRRGVARASVFVERFITPSSPAVFPESSLTESLKIRVKRRQRTIDYRLGETILDSARRAGLDPPFQCEGGSCGSCMALVESGTATMRVNNALSAEEVEEGWILTCQSLPTSPQVSINYDA